MRRILWLGRLAHLAAVLIAGSTAIAADKVLLLSPNPNVAIDVKTGLGWSQAVGTATNASSLNTAMADSAKWKAYFIPVGRWELSETITTPVRWGYAFVGAGGLSKDLGENHYADTPGLLGGAVARLVWRGGANGTMMRLNSGGSSLSNIFFQGRPVDGAGPEPSSETPAKCDVGLQINCQVDAGDTNTSKCHLSHLGFYQCATGILVGRPTGNETANSADSIHAGPLFFYHTHDSNTGTCVHVRNDQSVDNYFSAIYSAGDPAHVYYQERGGKTHIGLLSHYGSANSTTAMIRYGTATQDVGLLKVDTISMDTSSRTSQLIASDGYVNWTGAIIEVGSAFIPAANRASIQVHCSPGQRIVLRNVWGLKPGTIKLTGAENIVFPNNNQPAEVILENCTFYLSGTDWPGATGSFTMPGDFTIFNGSGGLINSASAGPYVLQWRNCTQVNTGRPYQDYRKLQPGGQSFTEITGP